jgi:hypothetical protein
MLRRFFLVLGWIVTDESSMTSNLQGLRRTICRRFFWSKHMFNQVFFGITNNQIWSYMCFISSSQSNATVK